MSSSSVIVLLISDLERVLLMVLFFERQEPSKRLVSAEPSKSLEAYLEVVLRTEGDPEVREERVLLSFRRNECLDIIMFERN